LIIEKTRQNRPKDSTRSIKKTFNRGDMVNWDKGYFLEINFRLTNGWERFRTEIMVFKGSEGESDPGSNSLGMYLKQRKFKVCILEFMKRYLLFNDSFFGRCILCITYTYH